MKRFAIVVIGIILVLAMLNTSCEANNTDTYTYTNLGTSYIGEGINNAGTIVGFYENGSTNTGFMRSGGQYTFADYPGSTSTNAIRINDADTIVGIYKGADGNEHGFYMLSGGTPTSIDYPGASNTYATGINNSGTIVGCWTDASNKQHGFTFSGGQYSPSFDYQPGASGTYPTGINDSGTIVGSWTDAAGAIHGFTLSGGQYTSFDVLGASSTYPSDINNAGTIVGWWTDSSGGHHSFSLSNGVYAPIDIANNFITQVYAINDAGSMVGSWLLENGNLITGYTANIVNVANINNVSDTFTIWMDLQQNTGGAPTPATNQCTNVLKIVDSSGRTAIQQSCAFLDQGTGRHQITFQITDDTTQTGTARDIVNGSFYICLSSGSSAGDLSSCSLVSGTPPDFAVYGTTFDIGKHAWQFANASWEKTSGAPGGVTIGNGSYSLTFANNFFKAAGVIQNYLTLSSVSSFWTALGTSSYQIGLYGVGHFYQESIGQCYGMANSAIANYTHQQADAAWGIDAFTQASWNTDIVNRWTDNSKATSPFGVLAPGANIFTAPSLNDPTTVWTIDSAKKIMYYFVAQPVPYQGGQYWVGHDLRTDLSANTEGSFINILISGSPVKLGLYIYGGGGHAVVVPQLIIWNGHRNFMIYDNNWPLGQLPASYGPYTGIYLDSTSQYSGTPIPYIETSQSTGSRIAQETHWYFNGLNFMPSCSGDSQNVYNQWGTSACSSSQQANLQLQDNTSATTNYPDPNYIQVLVIGAQVNSVYDQTANSPVTLIPNGDFVAGQAVQTTTGNGLFTSLYLPIADTYLINATKYAGFAGLEVFVTLPNTDGTVQILNYENLATAVADATQITFTVGRGNTNTGISRTIANDIYNPDYNANLATVLNPPTNLNGVVNNGGTGVALSWTNTNNPLLASVLVIRKAGSAPISSTDGVTVFTGTGQSVADTVTVNTVYYYAAYSMDGSGNLSAPTIVQVNTGLKSVYGTITLTSDGGLSNASIQLLDSNNNVIGIATSGPDGTYAISNIANGSYTLTASHPTAVITNPSVAVTLNGNSQEVDFSATNQGTLFLLFNSLSVTVGNTLSIPWAYRNIGNSETVNINLLRNGVWEIIASGVPILNGMLSWTVTGPDVSSATLEISLADNATINAQFTLVIAPSYNFLGTPTSGSAPLGVMFVDQSSSATAWLWDFGDGTTSTEQNPLHMYANTGTYTVSETVTATGGQVTTTKNNYITVSETCSSLPVTIADTNAYYPSMASALSVVGPGQTLLLQETNLAESPITSQDVSITLSGGYSCDYSMNPGFTTVTGTLTISQGTVAIENLIIQ